MVTYLFLTEGTAFFSLVNVPLYHHGVLRRVLKCANCHYHGIFPSRILLLFYHSSGVSDRCIPNVYICVYVSLIAYSLRLHLIKLKYNKKKVIVWDVFYLNIFKVIPVIPVIKSLSWSMFKTVVLLYIFCETVIDFQDYFMNWESLK